MRLLDVLCDVKVYVVAGIVLAMAFGFDSPQASAILMVVLIAQMAVSLDGISFRRDDFSTHKRPILVSLLCCFGVNTLLTLATGAFFIGDTHLWTGWVMLASVPCAVSVVVCALVMHGDAKLSVLSLTAIYVAALALTPLITKVMLGSAVNPLEILKYIVLFIAVPFALSLLVKRLHLKREPKTVFINLMMLMMVFIGLGSRREFILSDADAVLWLIAACFLRIFVFSIVLVYILRRIGVERGNGIVYMSMATWRNSGLSISMTMALFSATMPDAVLPCVVSLVMEAAWFAVMSKLVERIWPVPPEDGGKASLPAEPSVHP